MNNIYYPIINEAMVVYNPTVRLGFPPLRQQSELRPFRRSAILARSDFIPAIPKPPILFDLFGPANSEHPAPLERREI
jgi:hypothetical protein